MRRFLKHIICFAIPGLVGVMLLFTLTPDKLFSYRFVEGECSNKASWIYDRLVGSPLNTDVVFLGASQTACAVKDSLVERTIQARTGNALQVASLGYCRGGRDIQFVLMKEVFRNKNPKLFVIEVTEDEPKKSHPVFPYLADTKDLFRSAIFFNQRYLQAILKGWIIRFEYLKWKWFSSDEIQVNRNVRHGYIPTVAIVGEEALLVNRLNWKKRLSRKKSDLMRSLETRYSRHYLDKMIKMADEHGSKVIFLYLRESGSGLEEPMQSGFYQSRADMIILPDTLYSTHTYWSDATHFNDRGATLASMHIAGQIADAIGQP
jgi:hypothetical protein